MLLGSLLQLIKYRTNGKGKSKPKQRRELPSSRSLTPTMRKLLRTLLMSKPRKESGRKMGSFPK
jgi:hypothetical protein